jgi:hypothetical protein
VIIHRIIQAVEHEKFAAELLEEILIAHARLNMSGDWSELVISVREDVAFLVQAIDLTDTLGIHEIGCVPATRSIEDDIVRAVVSRMFLRLRLKWRPNRRGNAESCQTAELQKIAPVMFVTHREKPVAGADK